MKKIFRHLLLFCALTLLLAAGVSAQQPDARLRTVETVVADNLARLPAATPHVFNQVMGELAATGSRGVELVAGMLVPAAEGPNATFEYALNGMVAYATAPGNEALREGIRKGLLAALETCTDNANRAFLLAQLEFCSAAEDASALAAYLDDAYLAEHALRVLILTPGSEPVLLAEAKRPNLTQERKRALAYACGEKRMTAAEPMLLAWLADAEPATTGAIYRALSRCGSGASLKTLGAAAARVKYADEPLGATAAYLDLLSGRVKAGEGAGEGAGAVKAAKGLLKCDRPYVRGAALGILVEGLGTEKAMPYVLDAVKKGPSEYRFAALQSLGKGDDELFARVAAGMPRYDAAARAEVIAWLGDRGAVSQSAVIAAAVASDDDRVAKNAIEAAGRVGGDEALAALAGALEGPHGAEAMRSLLAFNGDIDARIAELLKRDDVRVLIPALQLAAERRMTAVGERVFALLGSRDEAVRGAAYAALPYVVVPEDAERLATLLDTTDDAYEVQVQSALIRAVDGMSAGEPYGAIVRYMEASEAPGRYYPVLANTGTEQAVLDLLAASAGADSEAAFAALLIIDNPVMIEILYTIAAENPELADRALARCAELIVAQDCTPVCRYQLYRRALEMNPSADVRMQVLRLLAGVHELPALMLAADYLGDAEVAPAAAFAVKTIVAKSSPTPGGELVAGALTKARAIYNDLSKADPDAGYAANEITEQLGKLPSEGFVVLPAGDLTPGSKKEYENFELWFEWRSEASAELVLRSMPQLVLGVDTAAADNARGEWNTLRVKVVNDRMNVWENGVQVLANVVLRNTLKPSAAAPVRGSIGLGGRDAAAVEVRDVRICELASTPVFELPAAEKAAGYEVLFDGRSLHKWKGNTVNYVPVDGTIFVSAEYGGSGNLYTIKEYGNFNLRFEFRFMTPGVNNGIGIRTRENVDAAYDGMEIQVLDHDAPIYQGLAPYQRHGSVYGIIPARNIAFGEVGTWNTMEINADGDRITVVVNGEVLVDGSIREACQGHNMSDSGEEFTNEYTVDGRNHPGLFNKKGNISFCGHGPGIQYRHVRVLDLDAKAKRK